MPNDRPDRLSMIVAVAENGVIGRAGGLPWRLSADLRRFKQLTMGHHLIMGRKTYASIGRLLPGRTTIIVSRRADRQVDGAITAHSLPEAYRAAAGDSEAFIVGGGEIYAQSLPDVTRLYLTLVHARPAGDTWFPDWDRAEWRLIEKESHAADERNTVPYTFQVYERITGS